MFGGKEDKNIETCSRFNILPCYDYEKNLLVCISLKVGKL
jgi:hypothetical protein